MTVLLYRVRRLLKDIIVTPVAQLLSVIHPIPFLSAFLFVVLLVWPAQPREVYFSSVEGPLDTTKLLHLIFAFLALRLLSASLYYATYVFGEERAERRRPSQSPSRLVWLLLGNIGWMTAYVPWLGLAWSIVDAGRQADKHVAELAHGIGSSLGPVQKLEPRLDLIDQLPPRLYLSAAAVALAGLAIVLLVHRYRRALRDPGRVLGIGVLLGVFLLPSLLSDIGNPFRDAISLPSIDIVPFYRAIGPLAMMALVATSLVALLGVVSLLSAQIEFPLIRLCIGLLVLAVVLNWPYAIILLALSIFGVVGIFGLFASSKRLSFFYAVLLMLLAAPTVRQLYQLVSGSPVAAEIQSDAQRVSSAHPALQESFKAWLKGREADRLAFKEKGKPYPVLIVSMQGGGIFAADAAATFLSRMQDLCDGFARHVFAISGVSGGAVGAAVFQTMMDASGGKAARCRTGESPAAGTLSARTSAAMLDDHLSSLLGMLPADLLGLQQDRALALESSFVRSVNEHGRTDRLGIPFNKHWTSAPGAPALLLNATWVETGFRVAFAPFALDGMRDGTLYAFGDRDLAGHALDKITVARAAVISARFPGVVPAFSLSKTSPAGAVQRWNFVDGGYADESGSATALEVYKAIEASDTAAPADIDLRLVVLTQARAKTDFTTINGTLSRDLLAPANTLFSVRDLLSRQAVMRTLAETDAGNIKELQNRTSRAQIGLEDMWKAAVVELDRQTFSLALGWNISQSTHAVVSLMIGWPELCPLLAHASQSEPEEGAPEPKISAQTIRANSCVLQSLARLITP